MLLIAVVVRSSCIAEAFALPVLAELRVCALFQRGFGVAEVLSLMCALSS